MTLFQNENYGIRQESDRHSGLRSVPGSISEKSFQIKFPKNLKLARKLILIKQQSMTAKKFSKTFLPDSEIKVPEVFQQK